MERRAAAGAGRARPRLLDSQVERSPIRYHSRMLLANHQTTLEVVNIDPIIHSDDESCSVVSRGEALTDLRFYCSILRSSFGSMRTIQELQRRI